MAASRRREDKHHDLINFTSKGQQLAHSAKMEVDISNRRRAERTKQIMNEERMQKMIEEGEYKAKNDQLIMSQNEQLATELERRRIDRERKEREIQRICEESTELKALESRLKVAYMNKERAAQHEEREVLNRMEREQQMAMEDAMEVDRQFMVAAEMEKAKARRMVTLEQKSVLQLQIREREELLIQAQQEAIRDKAMVDEVVSKIEAEDAREYALRERRKEDTRKIIKDYEIQREVELKEKKRKEAEAEAEIKRHMEQLMKRDEGIALAKANKDAGAALAFQAIAEEAARVQREEEEMTRLRDMLWEEEMEAARRKEDIARAEGRQASKAEMALANKQMLEMKQRNRELEAAEEERLVKLMMEKFAKDEADERAGEERRRANQEVYKKQIADQKQLRLDLYAREKNTELESVANVREEEEYRKAVVAEARRRLLEEHARRLDGFLPKGALQNQEEAKIFRNATTSGAVGFNLTGQQSQGMGMSGQNNDFYDPSPSQQSMSNTSYENTPPGTSHNQSQYQTDNNYGNTYAHGPQKQERVGY
mmetsp:Transcript_14665/g.19037  ORF Transcript_14665/g.19037 Transcript_14665/m.19037 type:complete len:542 (+) Transcript_14665:137-1762(+)